MEYIDLRDGVLQLCNRKKLFFDINDQRTRYCDQRVASILYERFH